MKHSLRRWTRIGVAGATIFLLGACGGKSGDDSRIEIRFWQFWDIAAVEPLVEQFEALHPDIDVKIEQLTWKSGLEKIQAAMASGTQPDVCELGSTWLPRFSYEGVLEDVTDTYTELADSFLMWDSARWQGRVYGLPWVQGSRVLFYNRDLFRQAGIDPDAPPRTWEELRVAAQKIDALGPQINGFGQNLGERYVLYKKFIAFAWGNGGSILDENGKVTINDRQTVEALEYYLSLAEFSLQEKQEILDREFKIGRLGMQISGAWNLKNFRVEAPALDYGVALVPRPGTETGTHASFAGAEMLVLFKGTKHREAALALARFLQEYPQAKTLCQSVEGVFPAATSVIRDKEFIADDKVRVFLEQSFTSRTAPAHPGWIEMEDVINRALEETLYGRVVPRWSLDSAAKEIEVIVAKYAANK